MAIRFKLRGVEFETDSAEEAQDVLERFSGSEAFAFSATDSEDDNEGENDEDSSNDTRTVALGANARAMLKILLEVQPGHGKPTETIAKEIGVNGPKGLAAVTRQIREWGNQKWGLDADECIERFISKGGNSCLTVGPKMRNKIKGNEAEFLGVADA